MYATLEIDVHLAPALQPETFVNAQFGEIVVILTSKHIFHTEGVAQLEHRCIEVDGQTSLFRVDECFAWCKAQFHTRLGGAYAAMMKRRHLVLLHGQRCEIHVAAGLVFLGFQAYRGLESPLLLAFERKLLTVVEHHFFHFRPLERREHIILVGVYKLVGG